MTKGFHNRGRGNHGGAESPRGRGRGSGNRGRGRGRGGGGYNPIDAEYDFSLQQYPDSQTFASPRGRGRPQSGTGTPRGRDSPRGRGRGDSGIGSPRGGRRGGGGSKLRPDAPLSRLLHQERPYLRPITFVPSVYTKTLFQEVEELLQPVVEDVDPAESYKSHAPTADRVSRVFSGGSFPRMDDSSDEDILTDKLEEIDFNDLAKLTEAPLMSTTSPEVAIVEEKFTGFFIDTGPTLKSQETESSSAMDTTPIMSRETIDPDLSADANTSQGNSVAPSTENQFYLEPSLDKASGLSASTFFIDTNPTPLNSTPAPLLPATHPPYDDDDDEIIVYVAPHPRKGLKNLEDSANGGNDETTTFSPYVRPAPLQSTTASNDTGETSTSTPGQPPIVAPSFDSLSFSLSHSIARAAMKKKHTPILTPRTTKIIKSRERRRAAKSKRSFGAYGAMMEEAQIRGGKMKDPRWEDRRQGDSDLDWGDVDDAEGDDSSGNFASLATPVKSIETKARGKGKVRAKTYEAEGMEVDPELELDIDAMRSFMNSLMGPNAEQHMTMDDLDDIAKIEAEDEDPEVLDRSDGQSHEGSSGSDDEEVDAVLNLEEAALIAEPGGDVSMESEDDSDEDSDDMEDATPRTSFQARLEKLRSKSREVKFEEVSSDEEDENMLDRNMTWADEDEDFIAGIQDMLDENEDILTGRDRKARNKLFAAVRDGAFDDEIEGFSPATKRKDKGKGLPTELQERWERDRQKKATIKRERELARLIEAADPLTRKKGGKKGRKAMMAAARLDPTIHVIPNRIIDMTSLVQQIRRFVEDVGGAWSMSLPPTNKETRKDIHEMAAAFHLKSLSKGKGDARYITLTKITKTGIQINEAKIAKIVRRSNGGGSRGSFVSSDKRGPRPVMPKHRDGDVVGKAAPKIGESNLGFRMLALMGWSEGDRIGATGGLDVPLTAVIKNTKLGLGATR